MLLPEMNVENLTTSPETFINLSELYADPDQDKADYKDIQFTYGICAKHFPDKLVDLKNFVMFAIQRGEGFKRTQKADRNLILRYQRKICS